MTIKFDRELIEKCQTNAPRYTSYPTADRFSLDFNKDTQEAQLKKLFSTNCDEPISLYIHIPFCNTLCLYCACNKIITNDRKNIARYITYLEKEIELYVSHINKRLNVIQLHFGGGSPSWMSIDEVASIMKIVNRYFNLENAEEVSMEIDPRHTTAEFIYGLRDNGFNRISIGLQDLDKKVQKLVNRVQSFEESRVVLEAAKQCGFGSTNIDLIYGLPLQTLSGFEDTIDRVIELSPERIALFNYAHIPSVFMPQTRILESDLPAPSVKLDTLAMSVEKLSAAGYVFIGMDHFARPEDSLAIALKNGTMQRNFQGYSTFADTNMLSFGVSSIGFLGDSYYQNTKDLDSYYSSLDSGVLPIQRGVVLTNDDLLRKYIIGEVMCQFSLNYSNISKAFSLDFSEYFATEIIDLHGLSDLGLIEITDFGFVVKEAGRFLIRNIAVVFDKYYRDSRATNKRYSKVI